jgi:hypothetical protein
VNLWNASLESGKQVIGPMGMVEVHGVIILRWWEAEASVMTATDEQDEQRMWHDQYEELDKQTQA